MKVNAVIAPKLYRSKSTEFQNKTTVTTFLLMLLAIISGVVFYSFFKQDLNDSLNSIFLNFYNVFIQKNKPEIFSGLFYGTVLYIILVFLFSTSAIGAPFIYTLTYLKLFGLSTLIAYIYSSYGLKGIEYSVLVILPGKFLLILAILILTDTGVHLSHSIRSNDNNRKIDIKKQVARFSLVLIISTMSVLVDYFTFIFFSALFSF